MTKKNQELRDQIVQLNVQLQRKNKEIENLKKIKVSIEVGAKKE